MQLYVSELIDCASDREALVIHFRQLTGAERRLRFGSNLSEFALEKFVETRLRNGGRFFGIHSPGGQLIAVGQLEKIQAARFEIAMSVHPNWRGHGLGYLLLAHLHRLLTLIDPKCELSLMFYRENFSMEHLVRPLNFRLNGNSDEIYALQSVAALKIPTQGHFELA